VRGAGLSAAVTTEEGYARRYSGNADEPYRLPRFNCPNDIAHLAQIVNGLERAKLAARGRGRA
jgi:hypothetical protein